MSAVVPKFFGAYLETFDCQESSAPARSFLLLEDCGMSARDFSKVIPDDLVDSVKEAIRFQAPALFSMLHKHGLLQNSVKLSNLAIQPGPLCSPPGERSYKTASFRILDFGRAEIRKEEAGDTGIITEINFEKVAHYERRDAIYLYKRFIEHDDEKR